MNKREEFIYDEMLEFDIATPEELNLARNLMDGSWEEVLNAVCYVRTGYKTFKQWFIEEVDAVYEYDAYCQEMIDALED